MRETQAASQLPTDVTKYGVTVQKSVTAPLMIIGLYSPNGTYDARFLANYSYINLNDQFTRVPGIGSVQVFGAGQYAMRLWVKPDQLAKLRITVPEILAGRGLASVTVAIDPAPFRGVLPLPVTALKSAWPVLWQPGQSQPRHPTHIRAVSLRLRQRCQRGRGPGALQDFAVPASGAPLFQAATANLNPWTEAKVGSENPHRGPLLIISGEKDNTVPWAIANASFKREQRNVGVTEIVEIPNRGHAHTIDSGWREVAGKALAFIQRFV